MHSIWTCFRDDINDGKEMDIHLGKHDAFENKRLEVLTVQINRNKKLNLDSSLANSYQ